MRTQVARFLVGGILVCVLALLGTGVIFALHGREANSTAQASASQDKPVFGATHVYMRNDVFTPAYIQVMVGATVTWTNQDNVPHNVTLSPAVPTASGSWESGLLYPGRSYSYTFTSRGTFQYYCQEHPSEMRGTVIVT